MVHRKNNPEFIKNPLMANQSYIKKNGRTHEMVHYLLVKYGNDIQRASDAYRAITTTSRKKAAYDNVPADQFCGKTCNLPNKRSYPVDSAKRCRAALSYARYAPDPECIRRCAISKAKKYSWRCGVTTNTIP